MNTKKTKQDAPVAVTPADEFRLLTYAAAFVDERLYADMCKDAGIKNFSPSEFADWYGYVAVVPCKRNDVAGWLCIQ